MNRLPRFLKLPYGEKILLGEAFFLVILTRLILWIIPFRFFRRFFAGVLSQKTNSEKIQWLEVGKITRAVKTASRLVPFASCLTQALAAFWLIKLNGHSSELKIGVARDVRKELTAHAWLEINGRVVLGKSPQRYTVLDSLNG